MLLKKNHKHKLILLKDFLREYSPLLGILLCHYFLLNMNNPLTGMDVGYYTSRLLDLLLHFKSEDIFTTQWWTPSYGGGIPGYPSPVHYQYSVTPYLLLFFTPWTSTLLTYLIFNSLGYALILNYIKNHLGMETNTAIVSAVIFSTSGFWICHSLVGHLSYHTFPLIAVVPYVLSSKWSCRRKIIVFSSSIVYMIHSGAFFPIYLTILSFVQLLFIYLVLNKIEVKKLVKVLLFSVLIVSSISLSKLVAVSMHMDVIPRLNSYSTWQSYFISFPLANLFQLFSWRYLFPVESLLPNSAESILFWICGSRYEFWENDVSISPVFLPIFIFFLHKFKLKIKNIIRTQKRYFFLLILTFWISAEISIGKGLFWSLLKDLPVLKSTHVNVRYCGSIVLIISILTAYSYSHISRGLNSVKNNFFLISIISISLLSMLSYSFIIDKKTGFYSYDIQLEENMWNDIQSGNLMCPLKTIVDTPIQDHLSHFNDNASCYLPHDPLYGYHGHYLIPSTKVGKINSTDKDGFYNFHQPMTFYNPEDKSQKRERIHSSDAENFDLFINRKQPKWELPKIQKVANNVTLISLFLFLISTIYLSIRKLKCLFKKN